MPKLVQINSVVNTGSTGRIVEQIGQLANANGWESYVAYARESCGSQSSLVRIGSTIGIYLHALASKFADCHGLMSRRATGKFLKWLDVIKPDVVHLHNVHGYYINYPMLFNYLKDKKIPVVITLHDFWLMTGHCAYINNICDRWKSGCGNCPRLAHYPSSWVDRTSRNWALKSDLIDGMSNVILVPVSNWLGTFTNKSLLKGVRQQIIYNGIDTEMFKPFTGESCVYGIDWNKFSIMSIATRWTEDNGFDDVIRLSSMLPGGCQIIIVGLNDKQMKSLPDNIIGFKKIECLRQLQELYTRSDVIFNPNREVTFGLVTAEAMSCGTPAIVYRNTAGEEVVDDATGYVIDEVGDVIDLISSIKKKDKVVVSQRCRARVCEHFNAALQYRRYIDLYNSLLENK